MTPKEKANELVDKMYNVDFHDDAREIAMRYPHAIKCALVAVDEIMKFPKTLLYTMNIHRFKTIEERDVDNWLDTEGIVIDEMTALEYWQEVKQEIEKL
jgi:hypothetical protein